MSSGKGLTRRSLRRLVYVTAASVASSCLMSLFALKIFYTVSPGFTMTAAEFQNFVVCLSIAMPLMICPFAAYRSSRAIEHLSVSRDAFAALSQTDQLTGLLNRRGFETVALTSWEAAKAAGAPTAILVCDIDRFKKLNDDFGHGVGDGALAQVAGVLRDFASRYNLIAGRHGGDEFVLLLADATLANAADIAEEVRLACAKIVLEHHSPYPSLSVSLGVAVCPDSKTPLSDLLRRADVALYDVKRSGRNRVIATYVGEHWSSAA
jgi:diguanylate cyclase (GGDEF)-like protein